MYISYGIVSSVFHIYVEKNKEKLKLSNIYWFGETGNDISLARANWNGQDAFIKCVDAFKEEKAFNVNIDIPCK
jgi:hypothetical protein